MWRMKMAIDSRRKLVITKKWEAQRNELIKLHVNKRQKAKVKIYNSLMKITTKIRDSIIDTYYIKAKKKHLLDLANWVKKIAQTSAELNKSELRSEPGDRSRLRETPRMNQFEPQDRTSSAQPKKPGKGKGSVPSKFSSLNFQSSIKKPPSDTAKSPSFRRHNKVRLGLETGRSGMNAIKETSFSNAAKIYLALKKHTSKPPVFKYCPSNEELIDLILNAES